MEYLHYFRTYRSGVGVEVLNIKIKCLGRSLFNLLNKVGVWKKLIHNK
jgi:hypothetical protein